MKINLFYFIITLLFSFSIIGQQNQNHTIQKGESLYSIAKKHNTTVEKLIELNPEAKTVLKLNATLKLTNKTAKTVVKDTIHEVLTKETVYGISKKYKLTPNDIYEANPGLKETGLQVTSKIKIPLTKSAKAETVQVIKNTPIVETPKKELPKKPEILETIKKDTIKVAFPINTVAKEGFHIIQPKETKYGLAKKYQTTIAELERLNPEIKLDLPIGFVLKIKEIKSSETEIVTQNTDQVSVEEKPIPIPLSPENMGKADFILAKANTHIGTRYRSGGTTSGGFDCSGLVYTAYKEVNITLPRTSAEMGNYGIKLKPSLYQKGDLIFFSTNGRGNINHVGIITEILSDEIKFIHASVHSGVIISSTKESYYAKRFVQVNRVLD